MCRLEPRIAVGGRTFSWVRLVGYPAVFFFLFFLFRRGPALKYHYNLLEDVSYTSDAGPFDSSKVELLPAKRNNTPNHLCFPFVISLFPKSFSLCDIHSLADSLFVFHSFVDGEWFDLWTWTKQVLSNVRSRSNWRSDWLQKWNCWPVCSARFRWDTSEMSPRVSRWKMWPKLPRPASAQWARLEKIRSSSSWVSSILAPSSATPSTLKSSSRPAVARRG